MTGQYVDSHCQPAAWPAAVLDPNLRRQLWAVAEQLTHITDQQQPAIPQPRPQGATPMASNNLPIPTEGFLVAHSIVATDLARSRDFNASVLGAQVILDGQLTILKLANSWVMINLGGGPTDDKPEVVLEPPRDPDGHLIEVGQMTGMPTPE